MVLMLRYIAFLYDVVSRRGEGKWQTARAILLEQDGGLELIAGPDNLLLSCIVDEPADLPHHAPRLHMEHTALPYICRLLFPCMVHVWLVRADYQHYL